MSTRRDPSFLDDILVACRKIETIVASMPETTFLLDEIAQAAVLHHLAVIGEATNQLSSEIREKYPAVPWRQIIAVRNRIVHAYFDLDWRILWVAATEDIPEFERQVASILARNFPDEIG